MLHRSALKNTADLIGIGGASRHVRRDVSTTRDYVHSMRRDKVPGVLRVDNGAFVLTREALAELALRVKSRL